MRKKIIAGNWKMNNTLPEAQALLAELVGMIADEVTPDVTPVLIPPFPYLLLAQNQVAGTTIKIGAQNCSDHNFGPYTGEVSACMLRSIGSEYVIIGHSERRQYFREDDVLINRKVRKVLDNLLTPILCCGEPLEIREQNTHKEWVKSQILNGLSELSADTVEKVIIAYEPIWAIGTGKTATSQQVQDMHAFIRTELAEIFCSQEAGNISILYGGSVKAANAKELFACPDVDGGLIGGASLNSREFVEIIKAI